MGCFILNVFSDEDNTEDDMHIHEEEKLGRSRKRGRVDEPFIDLTAVAEKVESLDHRMKALEKDKEEKDEKRRRRDPEIEITQTIEKNICDEVLPVFIFFICELVLIDAFSPSVAGTAPEVLLQRVRPEIRRTFLAGSSNRDHDH